MKKKALLISLIALCLAAMLLFTSCARCLEILRKFIPCKSQQPADEKPIETPVEEPHDETPADPPVEEPPVEFLSEEKWSFSANTIEEAKNIFDDFFYLTVYASNLIVTVSNNDGLLLTETVDGDKEHIQYAWGEETFAGKDGENYLYAVKDGNNRYYFTDENSYYDHILEFFFYLDVFADLPETAEISLTSSGTSYFTEFNVLIDATLSAAIQYDNVTMLVTAEKKSNQVKDFKNVTMVDSDIYMTQITFEETETSVTLPDLTDWFDVSAPLVASEWYVTGTIGGKDCGELPTYFDYVSGEYKTDYVDLVLGDSVTVKNKNDANATYSQAIDEDYLTGHQKIVFDPENESIAFECDVDPGE
ncbi:MAG: hypothetical protein IJR88_06555 [Clostridia bacterium]|nr:hypothetical protein [Clostridia bacterium]